MLKLIKLQDTSLKIEPLYLQIPEEIELIKIHFLFLTLGSEIIFIEDSSGKLVGFIEKSKFLEFKTY